MGKSTCSNSILWVNKLWLITIKTKSFCINLSKSGFRLVGGGTDINMSLPQDPILLSDTLWSYLNDFRLFLKDIIFGFVDAMRAEQSSKK